MSASNTNAYSAGTSGVDQKGHTYAAGSKADGSSGANAAESEYGIRHWSKTFSDARHYVAVGDKIKGGWNGEPF